MDNGKDYDLCILNPKVDSKKETDVSRHGGYLYGPRDKWPEFLRLY